MANGVGEDIESQTDPFGGDFQKYRDLLLGLIGPTSAQLNPLQQAIERLRGSTAAAANQPSMLQRAGQGAGNVLSSLVSNPPAPVPGVSLEEMNQRLTTTPNAPRPHWGEIVGNTLGSIINAMNREQQKRQGQAANLIKLAEISGAPSEFLNQPEVRQKIEQAFGVPLGQIRPKPAEVKQKYLQGIADGTIPFDPENIRDVARAQLAGLTVTTKGAELKSQAELALDNRAQAEKLAYMKDLPPNAAAAVGTAFDEYYRQRQSALKEPANQDRQISATRAKELFLEYTKFATDEAARYKGRTATPSLAKFAQQAIQAPTEEERKEARETVEYLQSKETPTRYSLLQAAAKGDVTAHRALLMERRQEMAGKMDTRTALSFMLAGATPTLGYEQFDLIADPAKRAEMIRGVSQNYMRLDAPSRDMMMLMLAMGEAGLDPKTDIANIPLDKFPEIISRMNEMRSLKISFTAEERKELREKGFSLDVMKDWKGFYEKTKGSLGPIRGNLAHTQYLLGGAGLTTDQQEYFARFNTIKQLYLVAGAGKAITPAEETLFVSTIPRHYDNESQWNVKYRLMQKHMDYTVEKLKAAGLMSSSRQLTKKGAELLSTRGEGESGVTGMSTPDLEKFLDLVR